MLATGCSSKGSGDSAPKSVTVKHIFGETTIAAPPKRVVSAGFTEQDDLLAVGVVPVAVTNWFGDQPFGVWPWAQPRLGTSRPVVLNLDNGIQVDQIARTKPDLILAVNAGPRRRHLPEAQRDRADHRPVRRRRFFEPWKDQATAVGTAVFQADTMRQLITDVDTKFADVAKNNAGFKGPQGTVVGGRLLRRHPDGDAARLAHRLPDRNGFADPGQHREFRRRRPPRGHPRDKLADTLDGADVLIWSTESEAEQAALLADPVVADLRATKTEPQCLHHQGPRRGDRLRLATVLPGGGRPAARTVVPSAGLTARAWMTM